MPEMHLRQPRFSYSACGPFTKNKERIQKFKETGDTSYIYKNELDKACFQYDMAYGDFKDLARTTASDKILWDKAFNIAKNPKYDDIKEDKKSTGSAHCSLNSSTSYRPLSSANNDTKQNLQMNFINQLLENLKKEKSILHLEIFGVLI